MHGVLLISRQPDQCPEGILLTQKHQKDGHNLAHAPAVAHLLQDPDVHGGPTRRPPLPPPHSTTSAPDGLSPGQAHTALEGPPEMPSGPGEPL